MFIYHSLEKPATTYCFHLAGDNGLTRILYGRLKSINNFFLSSLDSEFISHMTAFLIAISNRNNTGYLISEDS